MFKSDRGRHAYLPSASSSRPETKAYSLNQDTVPQLTSTAALNVLFIGETNIGESSIVDLTMGSGAQKEIPHHVGRWDDVRSITLDGKLFILHASPLNGSIPTGAIRREIQDTLTALCRNGGVHLLVYCMNALHSVEWTHEIHHTIVSHSTPCQCIPAVAVITGISDTAQQENWWSNNEVAFMEQGPHFERHSFIPIMTMGAHSPTGGHISDSRRLLHELLLPNHAYCLDSEMDLNFQHVKPPSASSSGIAIVLLGETGVGKSSLVNLIAGKDVAEVSSDSIGCTKTVAKYTFEEKGKTFHLYDTPGLVDPLMDVERFITPIDAIQKLIRSLSNGNGPDLLLFCIDKPTLSLKRSYHLFFKVICGGEASFALAITKLEECQDVDEWWGRHGDTIRKYGIGRSRCIVPGRGKGRSGSNVDSKEQLRESLLSLFVARADRPKHRMTSLRSMAISISAFLRTQFSTPEKILMNECELEERTARELIKRISSSKVSHNAGGHTA